VRLEQFCGLRREGMSAEAQLRLVHWRCLRMRMSAFR
jgi:hypothetical protein